MEYGKDGTGLQESLPLLFLDEHYFESTRSYCPRDVEFISCVEPILPRSWQLIQNGPWVHVVPPTRKGFPQQGWKIHVSSVPSEAATVLTIVSRCCFQRRVDFKFACDQVIFSLINGKQWPRGSSGKFITIYPRNVNDFREILTQLKDSLGTMRGPYILSDRRFEDCKVLYYRFGGFTAYYDTDVFGDRKHYLMGPSGQRVVDKRQPSFWCPPWVTPPFRPDPLERRGRLTLRGGRYVLEGALSFSNAGGVYRALDATTGERVVIKEARPYTDVDSSNRDSTDRLEDEWRLLNELRGMSSTPEPIDFFAEWEHRYLVESLLEGETLSSFVATRHPAFSEASPSQISLERYFAEVRRIVADLVDNVFKAYQAAGVLYTDFSPRNFLVTTEGSVKIVDLESFIHVEGRTLRWVGTPGFVSKGRDITRDQPGIQDLCYGLGGLISWMCGVPPALLEADWLAGCRRMAWFADLMPAAAPLLGVSWKLMSDRSVFGSISMIEKVLADGSAPPAPEMPMPDYMAVPMEVVRHLKASASPGRRDRLFPIDPSTEDTLAVAFGASGVLRSLLRIEGTVPTDYLSWISDRCMEISKGDYPPGLYVGLSGIAWVSLELGLIDEADVVLKMATEHELLLTESDVFYGSSGYGLACLKFWTVNGNEHYLKQARDMGKHLLKTAVTGDKDRLYWPSRTSSRTRIGFARGASGVALFLLYLWLATGDALFLDAGKRALRHDISQGLANKAGHLRFPRVASASTVPKDGSGQVRVFEPYWYSGSAGIGAVTLRYGIATGSEEWIEISKQVIPDVLREITYAPSLFRGAAGLGNFALDCAQFLGDNSYQAYAHRIAQAILATRIIRSDGVGFPGESLMRLSPAYGTGASGIALFLSRLARQDTNFDLLLDELLPTSTGVREESAIE